jgi:hypothetical protein
MADEMLAGEKPAEAAPLRAVEDWAALKGTPSIWFRAACAGRRWTPGRVVDEATYDAAIHAAKTVECR